MPPPLFILRTARSGRCVCEENTQTCARVRTDARTHTHTHTHTHAHTHAHTDSDVVQVTGESAGQAAMEQVLRHFSNYVERKERGALQEVGCSTSLRSVKL